MLTQETILSLCFIIAMSTPFLFAYALKFFDDRDGQWHPHKRHLPTSIQTISGERTRQLEISRRYVNGAWQYRKQSDIEENDVRFNEAW